jgi:N-acetylglucosamine repressor
MRQFAQPIDRNVMRKMNQNTLLNLIRAHAPVSRTRLKDLSGLSLGTIMGITSALIEQQLVVETGVAESTGGRKAGLLEIYPDGGYAIGISLMEYQIVGTVLNLNGQVVHELVWPAPLRANGDSAAAIIAAGVEDFISHFSLPRSKIVGLGCGVSGPVNTSTGIALDSWILDWHLVNLLAPLTQSLDMPVFVDNSVNCLACYENLYGYGLQYHDVLLVTLGRGLGMATLLHNMPFRGSQGIGAEFGHIPIDVSGRLCECGNRGCLEAYVADHGIVRTYRELSQSSEEVIPSAIDNVIIDDLFKLAVQGDAHALQTFQKTATYLGIGLATLVNLYNPECIVIYGGEGHRVDLMVDLMLSVMKQHIFSLLGKNLTFIAQRNTTMLNWSRGAACLVLQDFYAYSPRLKRV